MLTSLSTGSTRSFMSAASGQLFTVALPPPRARADTASMKGPV